MRRYYNDAKKYKAPTHAETGAKLKYDILELRLHPERLTKWYRCREDEANSLKEKEKQKKKEHEVQEWILYETQPGEALQQLYPLRKKQTKPEEPSWVTRLEEWGGRKSDN